MGKKIIIIILTVMLIFTISGCTSSDNEEAKSVHKDEAYTAVEIETLEQSDIFVENILPAKVYASKDVFVMPKIVGKVEKINVSVGDKVQKDNILFVLNKEDIQKQVDQSKIAYEAAIANYDMTIEQIDNAKTAFERSKKLYEEGALSQTQYEQAELAASDKTLEVAEKGLSKAEIVYQQAMDALDNIEVKAPISGTITSIDIEVGEYASTAQPSMTIMDVDEVSVQLGVTENLINKIKKGDTVVLEIPSANYKEDSVINSVGSSVDVRTGLYPVKIEVGNTGTIKPGMFAEVNIKTDKKENVLAVKSEAVLEREGMYYVYTVDKDKAVRKEVKIGVDTGLSIEIISGLEVGDKVIIKGQNYINDGSKIKVIRGE